MCAAFRDLLQKIANDLGYPKPSLDVGLERKYVKVRIDGVKDVTLYGSYQYTLERIWLYYLASLTDLLHEFRHHMDWIDFIGAYLKQRPEATLGEIFENYGTIHRKELMLPWHVRTSEIRAKAFAREMVDKYREQFVKEVAPLQSRLKEALQVVRPVVRPPVHEVWYWPVGKPELAKVTYIRAFTEEEAKEGIKKILGSPQWEMKVTKVFTEDEWERVLGWSKRS